MLMNPRVAAATNAWNQLPNRQKLIAILLAVVLVITALSQSATVNIRNQWGLDANKRPVAGGMPLRIMFIGASMTLGEHSTGHNGYRRQVRDWLVGLGNPVNCVGANRYGDFRDNDVQAFGAMPIKPTLDRARDIVKETQPNLIIINSGSSDCFQQDHWGPAHSLQYMRELVEYLFEVSPDTTIIMSTVITCPFADECVKGVNAQIRQSATDFIRQGKHVAMAEMHFDQEMGGAPRPEDIGPDAMHPTDDGYFMMGRLIMEKIREVEKKGWLHAPVDNGLLLDGDAEDRVLEEYKTNGDRIPKEESQPDKTEDKPASG